MLATAESRWFGAIDKKFRQSELPPSSLWVVLAHPPDDREYVHPRGTVSDPVVYVWANWGVWQSRCPFCPSAQHASEGRWFYCAICLNAQVDHRLVPQVWPANRAEIEAALAHRPVDAQNWEPGETVSDLLRQDDDAVKAGLGG